MRFEELLKKSANKDRDETNDENEGKDTILDRNDRRMLKNVG